MLSMQYIRNHTCNAGFNFQNLSTARMEQHSVWKQHSTMKLLHPLKEDSVQVESALQTDFTHRDATPALQTLEIQF